MNSIFNKLKSFKRFYHQNRVYTCDVIKVVEIGNFRLQLIGFNLVTRCNILAINFFLVVLTHKPGIKLTGINWIIKRNGEL